MLGDCKRAHLFEVVQRKEAGELFHQCGLAMCKPIGTKNPEAVPERHARNGAREGHFSEALGDDGLRHQPCLELIGSRVFYTIAVGIQCIGGVAVEAFVLGRAKMTSQEHGTIASGGWGRYACSDCEGWGYRRAMVYVLGGLLPFLVRFVPKLSGSSTRSGGFGWLGLSGG